ncbi:unnamed protein product, partial [Staurois parvus]
LSLSPLRWWRGCLLSAEERTDLSCTCPLSGAAKAGNQKLETGTRLHNEAWSAGAPAPSIICARRTGIFPRIWQVGEWLFSSLDLQDK